MKQKLKPETWVGIFLIAGILMIIGVILGFGNIKTSKEQTYPINIIFKDAAGLIKDSQIRLGGVTVGKVTKAPELLPSGNEVMTRLEHNRPVTEVLLRRVDAAESFLRTLGLKGCRVRVHGDSLARIELPEKERKLFWDGQLASTAARRLRELGFRHITLDLEGYSRGSMNEPS